VQFWSSAENFRGFIDIYTRCFRRRKNEDGLYVLDTFGERGLLGMRQNDGVSIVRASGVGGGSLVYSNVTIRPPDFIFDDDRWPTETDWDGIKRDEYFQLGRNAVDEGGGGAPAARRAHVAPPGGHGVQVGLAGRALERRAKLAVGTRLLGLTALEQLVEGALGDPGRLGRHPVGTARLLGLNEAVVDLGRERRGPPDLSARVGVADLPAAERRATAGLPAFDGRAADHGRSRFAGLPMSRSHRSTITSQ
jgi:hypothetical protein